MSLWKNIDHPSGNGKPLFANTSNITSSSTIHGAAANTMKYYGSVFGVSVGEVANTSQHIVHPGWVSQKRHTGGIARIDIVTAGTGVNIAADLLFTDSSPNPGTGAVATFTTANSQNTLQTFSSNPAWNVLASITLVSGGTGYTNAAAITAVANTPNATAPTFAIVLGGRAGRITYETLVAMGSISSDDSKDDEWFPGA